MLVGNLKIIQGSLINAQLDEIPKSKRTQILRIQGLTHQKNKISLPTNKNIHKHIKVVQLENPKMNLSIFNLNLFETLNPNKNEINI